MSNLTTPPDLQDLHSQSEPTSMTLKCLINGEIVLKDNALYLLRQNKHWKITSSSKEWFTGIQEWSVVPTTSSTGEIGTLEILEAVQPSPGVEVCEIIGRVVQLGKKNHAAMLKIPRPGRKTLKLTLLGAFPNMKIGEIWQVFARLEENYLQIESAFPYDGQSLPENTSEIPPTAAVSPDSLTTITRKRLVVTQGVGEETRQQRLMALAHQALAETTQHCGWLLSQPVLRDKYWEWDASLSLDKLKLTARVQVNASTGAAQVYQYAKPQVAIELDSNVDADHLVVTPLGAARSIGASCFKVEIGPYEIVLDAGTRPKGSNPLPAFEHLENPNLILITHAHQDHIGALPVLHRLFPATPMLCTPGTREIAHVMLTDCLKVQQSNEDFEPLFDEIDLQQTLFHLETQPIAIDFEPLPGLSVRFIRAGHIVGAACIYLRYGDRTLLYTGDYNTTNSRTTDGLRLADLPQADILITESTYGAATHPSRKTQETELLKAVADVVQAGGNVLVPAFALGRAQEILLAIRTSPLFHSLKIPVYVDGLVRAVTDVFSEHLELLPDGVQNFAKQSPPFFAPQGTPPIIPIGHPRERPLAIASPSVIIASSGMLTGGASVYYASVLLERENAAVFISGYTDEESPGRFLQGLHSGDAIELEGKQLNVRAQIRRFNLSAHADKVGLTQVIHKVNPKHLILIHGSPDALHELARTGDLLGKYIIHIPGVGEAVKYGCLPEHLSQQQVAKLTLPSEFEVEVAAEVEGAWIRIPTSVVDSDPRWLRLAANGVMKAKWDGIALKLMPLSQQVLAIETAVAAGKDCCAVCQFFKHGYCQGEDSPLFELQVDPSAICLEFLREHNFSHTT